MLTTAQCDDPRGDERDAMSRAGAITTRTPRSFLSMTNDVARGP
jgi:hypothetical protein